MASATIATAIAVTMCSADHPAGGFQPNGYIGGGKDESSACLMMSITAPSNLSPMMPSSSSIRLNTTDHTQSARNRHASASKRRTSSPVEYRSSVAMLLTVPDAFKASKMPESESAIE